MRIAATVGAVLTIALPAHAQQQIATSEPLEAVLVTRDDSGQSSTMPLVDERLAVTIDEQHATTVLTQTYQNRTGRQVEGTYRLRPGGAARVEGFAYWNGEQKIVGEVFEREAAREVYRRVTQRRRDPGLLEQTGDGAFTFQIFPIQPNEQKRVELRYTQWLSRRARRVEYRAPIANPRADIAVTINSRHALRQVSSSSHAIRVEDLPGGGARVRVTGPRGASGSAPDVLALRWEVADAPWTPSVFIHRDPGHDGYFAFSIAAPDVPDDQIAAKDVTIVIDRSGSMAGTPIQQARGAAADIIRKLGAGDHVNVIAFDSDADPLFAKPLPIDRVRADAIAFVDRLRDGGGTDIARALEVALNAQNDAARPRVILFLTDGQSDTRSALAAATADRRDVRVFTVGLGAGVNRPLLSRLAAIKRGRFTYIEDTRTIEDRVSQVYRHISRPLLVDLSLAVADDGNAGGAPGVSIARAYPRSLPDLFDGDELVVTGRVRGAGPAAFTLRATLDGKPVAYKAVVAVSEAMRRPWVGRLWARSRVDDLLEEIALHGETDELKNEVIELALAYNFTTKYTAFLAIPADEITADAADALARARAKRQRAIERNADAAALDQPAGNVLARQVVASAPQRDMTMDAGDDDEADADGDYGEALSGSSPAEIDRRGCAGCTAGGQGAGGAWLALALALGAITRRRRRPRRR